MFKRLFNVLFFIFLLVLFPLVMMYQAFEICVVWPIYYIIKGTDYMDKYVPFAYPYFDLVSGEKNLTEVTLKRKYIY